jgi:hypothetical protein
MLILAVLVAPLSVLAQDEEEMELSEYTTEDGFITLMVPSEWAINEQSPAYIFASTEEALESDGIPEGEFGVSVLIFPLELISFLGIEPGETLEETGQALVDALINSGDDDDMDEAEIEATEEATDEEAADDEEDMDEEMMDEMEVEVIELEDGSEIFYVYVDDDEAEGGAYFFEPSEGLVALVLTATSPGNYEDNAEMLEEIALSVSVNVTAEELTNALMGGEGEE